LAQIADQCLHIENHVGGIGILHDTAIEDRPDGKTIRIRDFIPGDQAGAKGTEGIEALAPGPLLFLLFDLPVACAHIVGAGIPQDILKGLLSADVFGFAPNDHGQLRLIIDLVRANVRQQDHFFRSDHTAVRLDEDHRHLRPSDVRLFRMVAIVETHGKNVGGVHG